MAKRGLHLTLTFPDIVRYVGLGIAVYETVIEKVDRPSLLILAAGMMGLKNILEAQSGGKGEGA